MVEAGETGARWILAADLPALESDSEDADVLLLSPFDLFLQARDRELLVPDDDKRKELWVVLGRPGAILRGGEIVGTWRPRAAGKKLSLQVNTWRRVSSDKMADQAERLAAHRGVAFSGLVEAWPVPIAFSPARSETAERTGDP